MLFDPCLQKCFGASEEGPEEGAWQTTSMASETDTALANGMARDGKKRHGSGEWHGMVGLDTALANGMWCGLYMIRLVCGTLSQKGVVKVLLAARAVFSWLVIPLRRLLHLSHSVRSSACCYEKRETFAAELWCRHGYSILMTAARTCHQIRRSMQHFERQFQFGCRAHCKKTRESHAHVWEKIALI